MVLHGIEGLFPCYQDSGFRRRSRHGILDEKQDPVAATTQSGVFGQPARPGWPPAIRWSGAGLVAASWVSAASFGLYIIAFYLGAIPAGQMQQWNRNLPGLYSQGHWIALLGISAHFATGAVILLLGPIQLIGAVRRRAPAVHRWIGRIYVTTAGVAGLGGLGFILGKGTIGGAAMNLGFALYGALMVVAAVETYRHARGRRFEEHRGWAVRLFALAIGSWLYRMDYGFWLIAAGGAGHTSHFRGVFDVVMAYFFYLPNLVLAELYLRARHTPRHPVLRAATAMALNIATLFVAVGTYYFLRYYWGPAIVRGLAGRAG